VSEPDESVIEGSGSVLQKKLEDLAVRIGYFGMVCFYYCRADSGHC
jgi:hypothetical protein